jgi:integrase
MTLYPLPDVAARLHKSPRWLQGYLREQPFGRMARRTRLFTESDILALIESLPCPSARYVKPLINYFKTTPLAQIGQAEVETCARRLAGGCASSTVNRRIFTPMSAIMTHAAKRRLCDKQAFDRPSQPRGRVLWITFEEADMLIAGSAPHLAPLVTFMLFTGCRVGEALALDWRDVDLSRAHASFLDTKNRDRRGTPLHPRAVAALAGLTHRVGIVFRRPDKRLYAPKDDGGGQIKRAFAGACRRSGIDWLATSSVMNSNPASVGSGDCSRRDEAPQRTLLLVYFSQSTPSGSGFAAIVTIRPRHLARSKQNLTNFETDSQEIHHRNQFASDSGFV